MVRALFKLDPVHHCIDLVTARFWLAGLSLQHQHISAYRPSLTKRKNQPCQQSIKTQKMASSALVREIFPKIDAVFPSWISVLSLSQEFSWSRCSCFFFQSIRYQSDKVNRFRASWSKGFETWRNELMWETCRKLYLFVFYFSACDTVKCANSVKCRKKCSWNVSYGWKNLKEFRAWCYFRQVSVKTCFWARKCSQIGALRKFSSFSQKTSFDLYTLFFNAALNIR